MEFVRRVKNDNFFWGVLVIVTIILWLPCSGREGQKMLRIKNYQEDKAKPKRYWHPYTLQSLNSEKFAKIVNKIQGGEHLLLELDRSIRLPVQD
jgi:hypothetical protein